MVEGLHRHQGRFGRLGFVIVLSLYITFGKTRSSYIFKQVLSLGSLLILHKVYVKEGLSGILRIILETLKLVPGVKEVLEKIVNGEVQGAMKSLVDKEDGPTGSKNQIIPIPQEPVPREKLIKEIENDIEKDGTYTHDGKAFALVYFNDEGRFEGQSSFMSSLFEKLELDGKSEYGSKNEHEKLLKQVFEKTSHGNALNPLMFPSLRKYETEAISMTSHMLGGDENIFGAMTSGGTESILMVIKAYRERARDLYPHIKHPEIIAPITIHPAHEKAGHYFGVKIVHSPIDQKTKKATVDGIRDLINENTIGIAVSAPQYCHCVIDPVEEIAQLAQERGLLLHVDACYGGFILPWIKKLGYDVPNFDFSIPGVSSITADLHKYGYCPKGASFVLFRGENLRKYMYYSYSKWPGGLYISPTMSGTRPAANIAMGWATLCSIGQKGYLEEAKAIMETTEKMKNGVKMIDGIELVVDTIMSGFAIQSTNPEKLHIFTVADEMEERGWKMERQSNPDSLHCSIFPSHANKSVAETFIKNLKESVQAVGMMKGGKGKGGSAAIYGMVGNIPDKTIVDDFLKQFFSEIYKTK